MLMANLMIASPQTANANSPVQEKVSEFDPKASQDLNSEFDSKLDEAVLQDSMEKQAEALAALMNPERSQVLPKTLVANEMQKENSAELVKQKLTLAGMKPEVKANDPEALKLLNVKNDQLSLMDQKLNQHLTQKLNPQKVLASDLNKTVENDALIDISQLNFNADDGTEASVSQNSISQLMAGEHEFGHFSKNLNGKETSLKAPSSKLSTSDFMNLREISQNQNIKPVITRDSVVSEMPILNQKTSQVSALLDRGKNNFDLNKKLKSELTGSVFLAGGERAVPNANLLKTVDAFVTQGGMDQKPVLTHDALTQIANQVNLMSMAKQDGEIKIRLRPDHLGELQMSVKTEGRLVSIQIKAEEGESKRVIEDSLGSLKNSLADQNLTLSKVEVVSIPQGNSDSGMQFDMSSSRQNHDSSQFFNQSGDQGNTRQERLFEEEARRSNVNREPRNMNFIRSRAVSNQGLDLIA